MNTKQKEEIIKHGEKLNRIFNTCIDPLTLCKKLIRLQQKAHNATTCLCNTNTLHLTELNQYTGYDVYQVTEQEQDKFFRGILDKVYSILGEKSKDMVFINYDPRGYALKIKSEKAEGLDIYKDWGGYGIIAPEIN